jgi:hypothetical protein
MSGAEALLIRNSGFAVSKMTMSVRSGRKNVQVDSSL